MKPNLILMMAMAAGLYIMGACSSGSSVDDFDRSCSGDSDFAAVAQGDPCCSCNDSAVTRSEKSRYEFSRAPAKLQCGPLPANSCRMACPDVLAICNNGTCGVR